MIWGKFHVSRTEEVTGRLLDLDESTISIPKVNYECFTMRAILDLAIGFRVESNICCDRFHIGLDIGWEQHIWFDHNQRFQFRDAMGGLSRDSDFTELGFISAGFDFTHTNLVYGGLAVKIRFDF